MLTSQPRIHLYTLALLFLCAVAWTTPAHAQDTATRTLQIRSCVNSSCPPSAPNNTFEVDVIGYTDDNNNSYSYHLYCPEPSNAVSTSGMEFQSYSVTSWIEDGQKPYAGICTYAVAPQQCEPPTIGSYPDCLCPSGMVKPPPGVGLDGLQCVDAVDDPTDCADDIVFDTAFSIEGQYMCGAATDECPEGFDLGTAYNPETGTSVNTCNDGWSGDSSSSSSDSSSSSGNSSSDDNGDDSGGDSSSSDSETDNSSSSSSSSSEGTGCDPETEQCENEASGGQDCSAPPTCSGDPISCAQLKQEWLQRCPGSELGELNGIDHSLDIETRTQQAVDEYNDKFNEIAGNFEELVSVHFNGTSAAIPSNTQTIKGQEVELGPAARKDFFDIIRNLLYFGCLLFAFYIIMRAN